MNETSTATTASAEASCRARGKVAAKKLGKTFPSPVDVSSYKSQEHCFSKSAKKPDMVLGGGRGGREVFRLREENGLVGSPQEHGGWETPRVGTHMRMGWCRGTPPGGCCGGHILLGLHLMECRNESLSAKGIIRNLHTALPNQSSIQHKTRAPTAASTHVLQDGLFSQVVQNNA